MKNFIYGSLFLALVGIAVTLSSCEKTENTITGFRAAELGK